MKLHISRSHSESDYPPHSASGEKISFSAPPRRGFFAGAVAPFSPARNVRFSQHGRQAELFNHKRERVKARKTRGLAWRKRCRSICEKGSVEPAKNALTRVIIKLSHLGWLFHRRRSAFFTTHRVRFSQLRRQAELFRYERERVFLFSKELLLA